MSETAERVQEKVRSQSLAHSIPVHVSFRKPLSSCQKLEVMESGLKVYIWNSSYSRGRGKRITV
jgi:hypothetical protein